MKKRLLVKDKKLRKSIKNEERKWAQKNFLELLRRSARTISKATKS